MVDVLRTRTDTCLSCQCRGEHEFWRAFDFLPQWGMLSHSEKLARLQDYACHELHFFVQERDPELFQSTVLPLLQVRCVSGCTSSLRCSGMIIAVSGFVCACSAYPHAICQDPRLAHGAALLGGALTSEALISQHSHASMRWWGLAAYDEGMPPHCRTSWTPSWGRWICGCWGGVGTSRRSTATPQRSRSSTPWSGASWPPPPAPQGS